MKRAMAIVGITVMAVAGLGGLVGPGLFDRAVAADYHVNYDSGGDDKDGRTSASAWRHAPGDPEAQGVAARTRLGAGDRVIFADGVRYRGSVVVRDSGNPGAPITYMGATPGGGATIDGSELAARVSPCRSMADCGEAPAWSRMVRIEATQPLALDSALFSDRGLMRPAQGPDPVEDFYNDEPDDMVEVDGVAMSEGRVNLPGNLAGRLQGPKARPLVALWVKPNRVVYRPIVSLQGNVARFDPSGLKFYTDRPARAAVINHPALVDRPGEFAVLADGVAVGILPPGGKAVSVGTGRGGFAVRKASHVVIRDLSFENMSDGGRLAPAGVAIFTEDGGSRDIVISGNRFANFVMPRGQGPIIQRRVEKLTVTANRIERVVAGSGMRLSGSDLLVEGNEIQAVGRTALMLMNTTNALVRRNTITNVRGVHGNGISAYLANRNVRFIANTVVEARQPATFHGEKKANAGPNDLLFANNLFVATPGALGALISWGGNTRGVRIENNVILGGKTGLRLNGSDADVVVSNNIASGLIVANGSPPGWRVEGNRWTALSFRQQKEPQPPRIYPLPRDAEATLAAGGAVPAVCAIITSSPPGGVSRADARAVGSRATCP